MSSNINFYVFTTHKDHDRCSTIEQTWGQNQNLYFFTDRITKSPNYVACTNLDTYISHIYKNFYAIEYAYKNHLDKFDWFFFIGDDVFIYPKNLDKAVNSLNINDNKMYGEIGNTWPNDRSLYYVLGGGGILFNKTSLVNFYEYNKYSINELNSLVYSDVAIGLIGRMAGIVNEPLVGIFSQSPEFYGINDPQNHISFHYIKTKQQFDYLYSL